MIITATILSQVIYFENCLYTRNAGVEPAHRYLNDQFAFKTEKLNKTVCTLSSKRF